MATVAEKVKYIVSEQLGCDLEDVQPTSNLTDDLGADSLDAIELVMAIEEGFDLEIGDEEVENGQLKTVADVVALVEAKQAK